MTSTSTGLVAFFRRETQLFGIGVDWIRRLVLQDEVIVWREGVIEVEETLFAAWDLADLLPVPAVDAAWVLMEIPSPDGFVPVALRIGVCLGIRPVLSRTPLPASLFSLRPGAFPFALSGSNIEEWSPDVPVALLIDPGLLFLPREIKESQNRLLEGRQ